MIGSAKLVYKSSIDGDITIEQQIIEAENLAIKQDYRSADRKFERALTYDITRTVLNILSNATIKYNGASSPLCDTLQKKLPEIFFQLHKTGRCLLTIDSEIRITEVAGSTGNVELIDRAWDISKVTQAEAAKIAMSMYGVVTNASYSVIDERGVLGVFSPEKDVVVKPAQATKLYDAFKTIFGIKKDQRKFIMTEVPMRYSGTAIPVEELKLLENKKDATATVARIFGIQEDMILSGSTFDNKENAIIQTYTDFKGWIYGIINQIEENYISFRNVENYNITFPGVPQMNKPLIDGK